MNIIERLVAKHVVKKIGRWITMNGYKTKIAGAAAIATGVGVILHALSTGDFSGVWDGWLIFIGGLTALGIGGKLEKLTEATKNGKS